MRAIELFKLDAEHSFSAMLTAIDGVTEAESWAILPQGGRDYIHADGSIHGTVLHVASCQRMHGSAAFRNTEVRWRDVADQLEQIEPSWPAAVEYLKESQRYWLSTWEGLTDEDLDMERPTIWGKLWPTWKLIQMVNHHGSYHAGQIALLRYAVGESDVPPPSAAADIREHAASYPSW